MTEKADLIPNPTIEAIARTLYREGQAYGFGEADYVRLVNELLALSIAAGDSNQANSNGNGQHAVAAGSALPLVDADLTVRAFADADVALLREWVQEAQGRYFLLSRLSGAMRELPQILLSDQTVLGTIAVGDRPIGVVAYLDWNRGQRKAEVRKLIGDVRYRGRGYAKRAMRLWIQYGLGTMGLRKIYLNTLYTDVRNIRLNQELGFTVEGILRHECIVDGRCHDILRMGLVAESAIPARAPAV